MKKWKRTGRRLALLVISALCMLTMTAAAEYYDDTTYYDDGTSEDNSLYSLGLENATSCDPEFYYSTLEYDVTVEAGATELLLDPVKSADSATIVDISGTTLDEDGKATVYITVEAANGVQATYTLNVTSEGGAASTEAETEDAQAIAESEAQAESERLALESEMESEKQAALSEKQEQIDLLQSENDDFADRIDLLMKVLYGLVAFAVILLFFIINQSLRNKDLKDEVKAMKNQSLDNYEFARKDSNMRSDFYYTPVQNTPQQMPNMGGRMNEMSGSVQATFGTASQRLQAQPINTVSPAAASDMTAAAEEPALSRKEQKKQEKEARRAARKNHSQAAAQETPAASQPISQTGQQPVQQFASQTISQPVQQPASQTGQQPVQQFAPQTYSQPAQQSASQPAPQMQPAQQSTMVQSTVEEPDVTVDMIEL